MFDISIIIAAYNSDSTLVNTVNSVLNQKNVEVEIIIIEDGSTAPCLDMLREHFGEIIEQSDSPSIKYITQKNTGAYHARLNAVPLSKGKYLKFLDHDDTLQPNTLKREIDAFNPTVDAVLSNWLIPNPTSQNAEAQLVRAPVLKQPIDDFLKIGGVFLSAATYRTAIAKKALIPVKGFTPIKADDWLIFAQVCLAGAQFKTIDNIAYTWHQNPNQLSKKSRSLLVEEHWAILNWIESELRENKSLTQEREHLLANYYAKQLLEANDINRDIFVKMVDRIQNLNPKFHQPHGNSIYKAMCTIFGLNVGVRLYASIKNCFKKRAHL